MSWSSIANIIISSVSLLSDKYIYRKHKKTLYNQQIKKDELEIRKLEAELEDSKKADIRVNVSKDERNVKILTVTNCGKAIARNVVVKGLDQDRFCIVSNPNDFVTETLRPQESFEIHFTVNYGADHVKITMFWNDDFQQNNCAEQKVIIP